jgi:hypothetical protein
MSLHDLIASDVADVFLVTDDFATQIRRYINGDQDHQAIVTGIVTWYPTMDEDGRGRATKRRGEIMFSSSLNLTMKDAFAIGADVVQVEAISQKQDGTQVVTITQTLPETRGAKPIRTGDL